MGVEEEADEGEEEEEEEEREEGEEGEEEEGEERGTDWKDKSSFFLCAPDTDMETDLGLEEEEEGGAPNEKIESNQETGGYSQT